MSIASFAMHNSAVRFTTILQTLSLPLLLALFTSALQAAAPNGTTFNGSIPGEFNVSPTGAATYSIPIEVPPGIGGMQPSLSLEYNSQSGNGLLGVGWSLGGLSAISRCPTTISQDNFLDPVDFDSNDRFCLDGQRLVQVTNTGCTGGTEYRTEIDSYARVCSYGTAGVGPAWFKVWTKAGQVMEYANTSDSRIEAQGISSVLVWSVNRIEDTAGNYLTLSYFEDNANGEFYPLRIDYAGNVNQGLAPSNSVQFLYEQRTDTTSGWIAGSMTRSTVRMTNAQVFVGFNAIRDYRLTYSQGPVTNRARVMSLRQCDGVGSGAQCAADTVLDWSASTNGFSAATSTGRSDAGYQFAKVIDVNADGKDDLVYCEDAATTWKILVSNGNGFNTAIITSATCTNYQYALPIDYNTDGKKDLLVPYANGRFYVLISTGSSFTIVDTGIADTGYQYSPVVTDLNGDGRDDLALAYSSAWHLRINNGNGFNAAIATGVAATNYNFRLSIDYDSDGMGDILVPYANSRWYVLRSTGAGFTLIDTGLSNLGYENSPQVMDLNGDGRQDLVVSATVTVSGWPTWKNYAYLNNGAGFNGAVDAMSGATFICGGVYQVDYNTDGKTDLAVPCLGWVVYQSTGTGFETIYTNIPKVGNTPYSKVGDFNGDGSVDFAISASSVWNLMLHNPGVPDQLNAVDNGAGGATNIIYKPLTDASVYTKGAIPAYPQQSIQAPLHVVSEFSDSNGVGGINAQRYTYTDARVDLRGRGFLGFQTMTVVDEASQISTQTIYNQTFPYVGLATAVNTRRVGAALKTLSNVWSSVQPYGGVYQVRAGASTEWTYELNGALVSTLTTTPSLFDSYANPGQVVVTSAGGGVTHTKSNVNTYTNDDAQWHLGRLTWSTVTNVTPSGTDTRTSAFEYDYTTGLLTAEIIEPGDPQLLLRTEYGYDAYGNKTSVKVKDSGSNAYPLTTATSTTSYNYSQLAAGTYSITSANAKGHSETQVIDTRLGKPLSLTGPNGLTTTWTYDSFGRQLSELRADGTTTTQSFTWCDSGCAGVTNAVYKATTQTSGSAATSVYYDSLGRELRSQAVSLEGRTVYKDTQYNNLGQVTKVSRPYFSGSTAQWTDYVYDILGRVTKETAADGGITETTYNGLTTSVRRYSMNDSYNQTSTRVNNVEGNLVQVIDEASQATTYAYDPFGNLTRVTDPANNATVMVYDRRGRKTSMTDPDMGSWQYKYDAAGQLRWQKDAKLQTLTMTYDVLGRMLTRVEPEGTSAWTYDTSATKGIGKLWKVTGPNGYIEKHYYDSLGRLKKLAKGLVGATYNTSTNYDNFGRVRNLTYPSGFVLQHLYNSKGYLYRIRNASATSEVYWTAQESSPDGQITLETLGNGLQTVRSFDPQSGRMSYLGTYAGSNNVQMLNYQYDALGNLQSREDVNQNLSETFQYDNFNRLTQTNIAGVGTKTWGYDRLGNIKSKDGYTDYTYGTAGSKPHAVTAARGSTYAYDTNGNMTSGAGRVITWSSDNKPTRITKGSTTVDFKYGPDRERYQQIKTVGGVTTTTLYVGKLYEQETVGGVTKYKNYISAGGRTVAIRETLNSTNTMKYLHQDHLGSTDVITNASGQLQERTSFDAFGSRRVATTWRDPVGALTSLFSTRGFTGHEQLDDVGLIHMNGRVYDPQLGRFLSADPYIGAPANPQNLNRYSYVNNNPLSYTDPSGFFLKKAFKKIGNVGQFIGKNLRTIASIAVAAYVPNPYVAGFAAGLIASGGDLKAGIIGALTAGAFDAVGGAQFLNRIPGGRVVAHGLVGGTSSKLQGGSFGAGFLSAGFASASAPFTRGFGRFGNVVAASVAGGAGAELGGGKFKNGALTGAFSRLFNDCAEVHGGCLGADAGDGGRIEMRLVGDRLFPVRVFECATAECVAMSANLDLNDPGTQEFIRASDAKALSDLGTAASIVILKSPTGIIGSTAARTSLAADIAKTVVTGNPASIIPAVTGRFAQGVAETSLGVGNPATINRIGAGTGLVIDQVINDE